MELAPTRAPRRDASARSRPRGSRSCSGKAAPLPAQTVFQKRDAARRLSALRRRRHRPGRQLRPGALPADARAPRRLARALLAVVPAHRAGRRGGRPLRRGLRARLASPDGARGLGRAGAAAFEVTVLAPHEPRAPEGEPPSRNAAKRREERGGTGRAEGRKSFGILGATRSSLQSQRPRGNVAAWRLSRRSGTLVHLPIFHPSCFPLSLGGFAAWRLSSRRSRSLI